MEISRSLMVMIYSWQRGNRRVGGRVRPKFGICVPETRRLTSSRSCLSTPCPAYGDLRQLIYRLANTDFAELSQVYERGKVLVCWSRFLLVLKVEPEGCAARSTGGFFQLCVLGTPLVACAVTMISAP
jgi:hypothetical protein